jgi:hypothetical protein
MTSRSSEPIAKRIAALAARRDQLGQEYARARRQHRRADRTFAALSKVTHAQLACELRLAKAAPLKRDARRRRAAAPDLFLGEAPG